MKNSKLFNLFFVFKRKKQQAVGNHFIFKICPTTFLKLDSSTKLIILDQVKRQTKMKYIKSKFNKMFSFDNGFNLEMLESSFG
jgi:hypothetical protein